MHAGSGMDRRAGEVKSRQRSAAADQLRGGTEDQQLVELAAAAREIPADKARVLALQVHRRAKRASEHQPAEAGREFIQLRLDPVDDLVGLDLET